MRIGTAFNQYISTTAMLAKQADLSKTQMQLSTGTKILAPSDDPSGSVRALNLTMSLDTVTQHGSNITYLREKLGSEESALQGGIDVLQRAREVAVQALNGTNTQQDRQSLSLEVAQARDQLLSLANTRDAHGEYLFSGTRSQTAAFSQGAVQPPSYGFTFQGDVSVRQLQMSATRRIPMGDSGFDVFQDIPSSSVTSSANNGKQNIMGTLQLLTDLLQTGQVRSGAGGVIGTDLSASLAPPAGLAITPGVNDTIDLVVDGATAGTVTIPPPAAPATSYTDINALVSAINTGIGASPLNGTVTAHSYGNSVQFVSNTTGNTSSVEVASASASIGFVGGETGVGQQVQTAGSITGAAPSFPITYAAATPFVIAVDGGPQTNVSVPAGVYPDINTYVAAINTGLNAAGIDTQVTAQANGNNVQFVSASSGPTSSVQIFGVGGSSFLADAGFSFGQIGKGQSPLQAAMGSLLSDIDSAMARFTDRDASVGARMNTLDTQTDVNAKLTLDMKASLSDTKDLDYAEAISRFNLQQVALQAAQQTFVKVQGLSLFNYLR